MRSTEEAAHNEQLFREEITAAFKDGKLGVENGWLFEYTEPCKSPCAGVYGCPPSCYAAPIMDLWQSDLHRNTVALIQQMHYPTHGEDDRGPYVICNYDKTDWPCKTQKILDAS